MGEKVSWFQLFVYFFSKYWLILFSNSMFLIINYRWGEFSYHLKLSADKPIITLLPFSEFDNKLSNIILLYMVQNAQKIHSKCVKQRTSFLSKKLATTHVASSNRGLSKKWHFHFPFKFWKRRLFILSPGLFGLQRILCNTN